MLLTRGNICSRRRRRWGDEDKGRIVAESFEAGLKASPEEGCDLAQFGAIERASSLRSGETLVIK
jgi:transposase-like protein